MQPLNNKINVDWSTSESVCASPFNAAGSTAASSIQSVASAAFAPAKQLYPNLPPSLSQCVLPPLVLLTQEELEQRTCGIRKGCEAFGLPDEDWVKIAFFINSQFPKFCNDFRTKVAGYFRVRSSQSKAIMGVERTIVVFRGGRALVQERPHKGVIGQGAQKTVKKVFDLWSGEIFADMGSKCNSQFKLNCALGEAQVLHILSPHPDTLKLHEFFWYMNSKGLIKVKTITTLCKDNLDQFISKHSERLSQQTKVAALIRMADALHLVHEANFIHRDVKESNFLRTMDDKICLSDYGFTTPIKDRVMLMSGTHGYFAPEVLDPTREPSPAQDIWSLGVVFFRLIVKQGPVWLQDKHLSGLKEEQYCAAYRHYMCYLHSISSAVNESYPKPANDDPLELLIWSMLKPNPASRPTITEVMSKLESIFESL